MKSSPKRKFSGPTFHLNYVIQQEARDKLRQMVGSGHIGSFMEELILREYRRREKRAEKDLHEVVGETGMKPKENMQLSA